ncbi:MAG: BrxE family protein [Saprospiraceae bacterium]
MDNITEQILKLRIAVAQLGEINNWWKSSFFTESTSTFLDYIFPKLNNSQIIGASDLIRHVIDHKVGAHYHHLFRLGINYEEQIHRKLLSLELKNYKVEDLFDMLDEVSQGLIVRKSEGPKNIGAIQDLENEGTVQVMAAEYLSAFKNNYQVHPYLN